MKEERKEKKRKKKIEKKGDGAQQIKEREKEKKMKEQQKKRESARMKKNEMNIKWKVGNESAWKSPHVQSKYQRIPIAKTTMVSHIADKR